MAVDFTSTLTQIGLLPDQALLYQTLLQNGPQTAVALARKTPIKRTYIYKLMEQLVEKGLVIIENKPYGAKFQANSPDILLDLAETRKLQISQATSALENVIPTLKNFHAANQVKPVVTYYEGPEGVMRANYEILEEKQTILAYLLINKEIDLKMESYWKKYYQKRISNGIHVRAIAPDTTEGLEYQKRDRAELRITKLVPRDLFPFMIEKNICGNKVAFFSRRNNVLMATIIENQEIADSERAIFELIWNQNNRFTHKTV